MFSVSDVAFSSAPVHNAASPPPGAGWREGELVEEDAVVCTVVGFLFVFSLPAPALSVRLLGLLNYYCLFASVIN